MSGEGQKILELISLIKGLSSLNLEDLVKDKNNPIPKLFIGEFRDNLVLREKEIYKHVIELEKLFS